MCFYVLETSVAWDKSIIEGQLPVLPQRRQEGPAAAVRATRATTRTASARRWTTSPTAIGSATNVATKPPASAIATCVGEHCCDVRSFSTSLIDSLRFPYRLHRSFFVCHLLSRLQDLIRKRKSILFEASWRRSAAGRVAHPLRRTPIPQRHQLGERFPRRDLPGVEGHCSRPRPDRRSEAASRLAQRERHQRSSGVAGKFPTTSLITNPLWEQQRARC